MRVIFVAFKLDICCLCLLDHSGVFGLRCLLLHLLSFPGQFVDFQFSHSLEGPGDQTLMINHWVALAESAFWHNAVVSVIMHYCVFESGP